MLIKIILGILLVLFLPGFLVILIFFKKADLLEKIVMSIILSTIISFIVTILLGLIKISNKIYGFSEYSFVIVLSLISAVLIVLKFINYKNTK